MKVSDFEQGLIVTDGTNTYEVVGCLESDEVWWLRDVYTGEHTSHPRGNLSPAGPNHLLEMYMEEVNVSGGLCWTRNRDCTCIYPHCIQVPAPVSGSTILSFKDKEVADEEIVSLYHHSCIPANDSVQTTTT